MRGRVSATAGAAGRLETAIHRTRLVRPAALRQPLRMESTVSRFLSAGVAALAGIVAAAAQTPTAMRLEPVTVFAGQFPTGERPGALLNSLEVVRTPGTAADINRALQTFPGVQLPDEGNALFVRGGDSFETVTLVNGLRFPNATRLNAPAGNFAGTLNPFEARRIDFASGGFGARFGNALSAVVDLETLGAPAVHAVTLGGGLGAVSLGADVAFTDNAGLRFTATRKSTAQIFALNGVARDYPEPPNGHDFSLAGAWEYRPGAEVRVFAVEQDQELGLVANLPALRGLYRQATRNRLVTLSWRDRFGAWAPQVNVGGGALTRRETVGDGDVETRTRHRQFAGRVSRAVGEGVELSAGIDGVREETRLAKAVAASPGFAGGFFSSTLTGTQTGAFAEADVAVAAHLRVIVGARADESTLTRRTTVDPRVALAWEPRKALTFSLAGGGYRQVPEEYNFLTDTGPVTRPPMRADQLLGAVQIGGGDRLARVEIYKKNYADLVTLNRVYRPVGGGTGRAEGADVFVKTPLPWAASGRLTYSYVDTRRTDPDSGRMARAPFDVTHTAAVIVDRAFGDWVAGAAWRMASGRPITPISGGVTRTGGGFAPLYGAPFSEQLPSLLRLDLSTSRYRRLNAHTSLVLFVSVNNVLNRANVYTYEYSRDFAERRATPSLFKRTLYFGFSLQFN